MTKKLWKRWKSFIGALDFADVRKDVAGDLKWASLALYGLWFLSMLPRLPAIFWELPKALGIDAAAIQTSGWVSFALFGFATVLYVCQALLRVKTRKRASKKQESV